MYPGQPVHSSQWLVSYDASYEDVHTRQPIMGFAIAAMLTSTGARAEMLDSLTVDGGGFVEVSGIVAIPQIVGPRFTWYVIDAGGGG